MNTLKTNLVQSLEEIQEVNEMVAMMESYINYVNSSMAIPTKMLGLDMSIDIGFVNPPNVFQSKPTLIEIDVTKY